MESVERKILNLETWVVKEEVRGRWVLIGFQGCEEIRDNSSGIHAQTKKKDEKKKKKTEHESMRRQRKRMKKKKNGAVFFTKCSL